MKKRLKVSITIIILLFITVLYINIHTSNKNKDEGIIGLPKGELLNETTSPKDKYTVKTYVSDKGGATVDFAVRGELIVNNNNSKPKNIYWEYKVNKGEIHWENEDTVIINGHKIKLPNEIYDWRIDNEE